MKLGRYAMAALAAAFALAAGGCAQELAGEEPPAQSFYYPIGLDVSSDGRTAWVLSSNFDQRFNTGWVGVVDLDALIDHINDSPDCLGGCPAAGDVCVLLGEAQTCATPVGRTECGDDGCIDGQICIEGAACAPMPPLNDTIIQQLRVPALGGMISADSDDRVAVVTARGGFPLTQIDMVDGRELTCGDPAAEEGLTSELQRTDCDRFHFTRVVVADERPPANLLRPWELRPDEINIQPVAPDRAFDPELDDFDAVLEEEIADPFAVHVFRRTDADTTTLMAAVGYLGGGVLSIFSLPEDPDDPGELLPLQHERLLGRFLSGIGNIAIYPGATSSTYLAGTSNLIDDTSDRNAIYDVDLGRSLDEGDDLFRVHQIGDAFGGLEALDIVFAQTGSSAPRAYVASRIPDTITILDTRLETTLDLDADGEQIVRPRYVPMAQVTVPGRPSGIAYVSRDEVGGPDLVAVTGFDDDALYILAVLGDVLHLDRRIDRVGQGPYQIRHVARDGRHLLLVTLFFDHAVAVVDVTSPDPQRYRVLGNIRNPASESSRDRARF